MNTSNLSNGNQDTFLSLCKEMGKRINSTDNALLCYRAYLAYNVEHPETTQGQGNNSARDASCPAFRNAAAKASGVAVGTIDALLQVGKAIGPLPEEVKQALSTCSLSNWTMGLRKLATGKFDDKRAEIITTFAAEEKVDPEAAMKNLKKTLGMKDKSQDADAVQAARKSAAPAVGIEAPKSEVEETSHQLAVGESFEMQVGPYLVRVEVSQQSDGRIHLTTVHGKTDQVKALVEKRAAENATSACSSEHNEVVAQVA